MGRNQPPKATIGSRGNETIPQTQQIQFGWVSQLQRHFFFGSKFFMIIKQSAKFILTKDNGIIRNLKLYVYEYVFDQVKMSVRNNLAPQ